MSAKYLTSTLFSKTRSTVLGELFKRSKGIYLRELERVTGINSRQLLRELHALRDAGIITPSRVGNVVIYQFDPECPIHDELRAIVRKTVGLADTIRTMLEPFAGEIELAYVFGSFAAGQERSDSDIDVMVVGSVSRRQLSSAIRSAREALERELNVMIYASEEYGEALRDTESFVAKVHAGPRINLAVDSRYGIRGDAPT